MTEPVEPAPAEPAPPGAGRLLRLFVATLLLPVCGFVGLLAAVLLVVATTLQGHLLGLGFLALSLVVVLAPFVPGKDRSTARRWVAGLLGAAAVLGLTVLNAPAPASPFDPGRTGLQSVWLGPSPSRGLAWLTPEIDQAVLASHLLWTIDPWMDRHEAGKLRDAMVEIYAGAPPSYAAQGSMLGLAYGELWGQGVAPGHLFVDLPPGPGPFPTLVMVHGFGGNLLGYGTVLREVLHAHGYALVAPSYGAGLWFNDPEAETVGAALDWMRSTGHFDMDRLVLAGLSNGGYGVTAAAIQFREQFKGIAWFSCVMEVDRMADVAPGAGPMLVLHGGVEDRIPIHHAQAAVDQLVGAGAALDFDVVDDADHFLFFTHRARVERALDRWLTEVERSSSSEHPP